jgi:hypothetical protein
MKSIVLTVAALVLAGASAHAETYTSGRNRVVIPDGCASWSCMSVSVPGHSHHNDSRLRKRPRGNGQTAQR